MFLLARRSPGRRSTPATETAPETSGTSPSTARSRVDFPLPFAPTRAVTPEPQDKDTPRSTGFFRKLTRKLTTSRIETGILFNTQLTQ